MWMTSGPEALRILGIWEKSVSWVFAPEEEGWLSVLDEALRRVLHVVVVMGVLMENSV